MRSLPVALIGAASAMGLSACAGSSALKYEPFGSFDPNASSQVSTEYDQSRSKRLPETKVEILDSTLPAGVVIDGATLRVEAGAPFQILGRFKLDFGVGNWGLPETPEIPDHLKRVAHAARGNIIVMKLHYLEGSGSRIRYVDGFVLRRIAQESI